MSAPVIIVTQSVLEFLQHQSWEFQPYATNTPTFWNCSPLPPGMAFNPLTGLISGAATKPGVYEFGLLAGNAAGISSIVTFTCGIEATSSLPAIDAVDVSIDLATSIATVNQAATRTVSRGLGKNAKDVTPLFWLKRGDVRLIHVRFYKAGVVADIALETLKLSLKAYEPESSVVASSSFIRCDTGENTFYRMAVTVASAGLSGELGNQESDFASQIAALGEFEWTWTNTLTPTFGPATLRSSSFNFDVGIARDLTPDA